MWIEKKNGEKKRIIAANWQIWKRRGASKCKPPKAEAATREPGGERSDYPRYKGGGWYVRADGESVRKSDLTADELEAIGAGDA